MNAATKDITVEQNATFITQIKVVKDGQALDLSDIEFHGEIKASIYDTEGYSFRFDKVDAFTVNMYLDAEVSSQMEFKKGVYDVKMTQVDGFVTRLLTGSVTNILGVS